MCQRKIINKETVYIVPLMQGCACPMIKEIRNVNGEPIKVRKDRSLKHCFDIHMMGVPAEIPGMHMVFRMCKCKNSTGYCEHLQPMFYKEIEEEEEEFFDDEDDENDDEDDGYGTGSGGMPSFQL